MWARWRPHGEYELVDEDMQYLFNYLSAGLYSCVFTNIIIAIDKCYSKHLYQGIIFFLFFFFLFFSYRVVLDLWCIIYNYQYQIYISIIKKKGNTFINSCIRIQ